MRAVRVVVELADSEQFQFVVRGKGRMLVERIELRKPHQLDRPVRLHGWTTLGDNPAYKDELLRRLDELPQQIQNDLTAFVAAINEWGQ